MTMPTKHPGRIYIVLPAATETIMAADGARHLDSHRETTSRGSLGSAVGVGLVFKAWR